MTKYIFLQTKGCPEYTQNVKLQDSDDQTWRERVEQREQVNHKYCHHQSFNHVSAGSVAGSMQISHPRVLKKPLQEARLWLMLDSSLTWLTLLS